MSPVREFGMLSAVYLVGIVAMTTAVHEAMPTRAGTFRDRIATMKPSTAIVDCRGFRRTLKAFPADCDP